MPKPVLDGQRCRPQTCAGGSCFAKQRCPVKAIWQEEPYSVPFLSGGRCNGCGKCVAACPFRVICLS